MARKTAYKASCLLIEVKRNMDFYECVVDNIFKRKNTLSPSTYNSYLTIANAQIKQFFHGKYRLCDIETIVINNFYSYCSEKGLKNSTIKRYRSLMNFVLDEARKEKVLPENPVADSNSLSSTLPHINPFNRDEAAKLDNGVIPCTDTGKKTHRYLIKRCDVLRFIESGSVFEYPEGMFGSGYKAKKKQINCFAIIDTDFAREWYNRQFHSKKDILTLSEVRNMTGYTKETIRRWILCGNLQCVEYFNTRVVPKTSLLEWMSSTEYLSRVNKSAVQIEQMNAMLKEKQQA